MTDTISLRRQFRLFALFSVLPALLLFITVPGKAFAENDISLLAKSGRAFASVVKKAKPSVVHITVEKAVSSKNRFHREDFFNDEFFERFFGPQFRRQHPQRNPHKFKRKQQGQGSGFIISKEGHILTNNHVVEDADTITVILADKKKFKAKVIGTDPMSDVALIKIENGSDLPSLPLGDSDKLEVGEWVIAIGNPFGLNQTVTVGVVSAKGRSRVGINEYENFIQTDAAINPGNSGGPLLNIHGQVIGINSALFSRTGGYMGIGFAIPINMVKAIENQLQQHGKVTRGWLGVAIQDVNEELAHSFGLKEAKGILVSEVQPGSPADKGGLKRGDVIISLGEVELKDVNDLRNRIALITPGTTSRITVIRDSSEKTIDVAIGERPSELTRIGTRGDGKSSLEKFGLRFQELTPELAEQLGFSGNKGVLIADVAPGSPAAKSGLRSGLLVEEVNKQPVDSIRSLQKALKKSKQPKRLLLRVRSDNFSHYVVVVAE